MLNWLALMYKWKYWPKEILYFPLTLYIICVESFRTGKLFYFSAANPKVTLGGFAGDSKLDILNHIPNNLKPITIGVTKFDSFDEVQFKMKHLNFPLIAKPDLGEGGFKVRKIETLSDLKLYHEKNAIDYVIQDYCELPLELTLLCFKLKDTFYISTIVERIPFTLIGDGIHSISQLIKKDDHGFYNQKRLKNMLKVTSNYIPVKGEIIDFGGIANWDNGSKYLERNELINRQLTDTIHIMMENIDMFHYARIDFKCQSYSDIEQGKIQILEINGVKGEPIQIYDPKYTLKDAYAIIFYHWNTIRKISQANIKKGFQCPSIPEGFKILYKHFIHKIRHR